MNALFGVALVAVTHRAPADPVSTTTGAPPLTTIPHLVLEPPGIRPLRLSLTTVSVPGFELAALPTFSLDATWLERGPLGLHTFSYVAPALELDCSSLCQPMLERAGGVESQLALGGAGPHLPGSWLYLGGGWKQLVGAAPGSAVAARSGAFVRGGVGGLLAF